VRQASNFFSAVSILLHFLNLIGRKMRMMYLIMERYSGRMEGFVMDLLEIVVRIIPSSSKSLGRLRLF
jgi:hypothetical protein